MGYHLRKGTPGHAKITAVSTIFLVWHSLGHGSVFAQNTKPTKFGKDNLLVYKTLLHLVSLLVQIPKKLTQNWP